MGRADQIGELEVAMNRAAETAVPMASEMLINAAESMTVAYNAWNFLLEVCCQGIRKPPPAVSRACSSTCGHHRTSRADFIQKECLDHCGSSK